MDLAGYPRVPDLPTDAETRSSDTLMHRAQKRRSTVIMTHEQAMEWFRDETFMQKHGKFARLARRFPGATRQDVQKAFYRVARQQLMDDLEELKALPNEPLSLVEAEHMVARFRELAKQPTGQSADERGYIVFTLMARQRYNQTEVNVILGLSPTSPNAIKRAARYNWKRHYGGFDEEFPKLPPPRRTIDIDAFLVALEVAMPPQDEQMRVTKPMLLGMFREWLEWGFQNA